MEEIKELQPGDIGAIGKLELAKTGDTLSRKEAPVILDQFVYSTPYTYKKYYAANKGEEDKISQALSKLCAEDKTLKVVADEENKQALLYGIGDQQLDVVASKMKEKYKVDKYQELYIDIGCSSKKEVLDLGIKIGNAITYYPTFCEKIEPNCQKNFILSLMENLFLYCYD